MVIVYRAETAMPDTLISKVAYRWYLHHNWIIQRRHCIRKELKC